MVVFEEFIGEMYIWNPFKPNSICSDKLALKCRWWNHHPIRWRSRFPFKNKFPLKNNVWILIAINRWSVHDAIIPRSVNFPFVLLSIWVPFIVKTFGRIFIVFMLSCGRHAVYHYFSKRVYLTRVALSSIRRREGQYL